MRPPPSLSAREDTTLRFPKTLFGRVVACFATLCIQSLHAHPITFGTTLSYSSSQPSGGAASVANWTGAAFDAANLGGSGINADGGANNGLANDASTYVANNQPRQGQTFTTGSHANGYDLTSLTVRMAGYPSNTATGANGTAWNLNPSNGPIIVNLGKVAGTNFTTMSMQCFMAGDTGTPGTGQSANGAGSYLTFLLPTPVHLDPNTTYGFDFAIGNGGANYFEWLGINTDPLVAGTAYTRSAATVTPLVGDRVFQANMAASAAPYAAFAHPGALHTQADFDRMAAKVAASTQPWKADYDILANSPWAQTWWPAYDVDYIVRGASGNNYTRSQQDAQAIYELALRWKITGDPAYANKAVQIANVWSGLIGLQGDTNRSLAAGICGYLFASGGEILSTYSGWPAAEKQAYKDMMMRVFYPENFDLLWRQHDNFWRDGANTHYRLNWLTANMASMAAIGILCDNRAVYQQAVDFFKYGPNNGRVERAAWYMHPGGLGQGEEAGRDQGHNMGGWYAMSLLCQMAWNQGEDLFGYDNNRVLRVFEYNAKYNLGNDVPYARHQTCDLGYTEGSVSGAVRGIGQYYQYELVYNHYANVKGIAAPWSKLAVDVIRPEPRPDPNIHPSQVDWLGLGSLTFARDTLATDTAPNGLRAHWSKNQIVLDWWGSARATGYQVKRATSLAGPYTQIGAVSGPDLNFTDTNVANGSTYYYQITAVTPSGELTSAALKVAQELVTRYTFEGNANDTVGTRHAQLKGGVAAPGFATGFGGGQAVSMNGANQYVQLPVGSASYQDITLAAWVYWTGGSSWQRVFDFGSEIEKTMYLTPKNGGGGIEFGITTSKGGNFEGDASFYLRGPALATNQWVHLAVTLNGDTGTLYVNGKPVDTKLIDLCDPLFGQPFCYLGRSMWNADAYLNGRLDDFRIYNYGLTGNEIYSLWGQGGSNVPPVFAADPVVPTTATEDSAYAAAGQSLATYASDANGGTLTYAKLVGPVWLTVASNGALSGTPANADVGLNVFTVRVTDASGATDDATLRITVGNTNDAPVWNSSPVVKAAVSQNVAYSGTLADSAFDVDVGASISFSKVSGPAWLTVEANGAFGGTPLAGNSGLNAFVVRATDNAGASTDVTLNISVLAPGLQARYALDDSGGNSQGGTAATINGAAIYVPGVVGQGLVFDGSANYATLGSISGLVYKDLTVAAWVWWDGGSNWQRIFDFGSGTNEYLYLTPSNGSNMRFAIKENGVEQVLDTVPMQVGNWNHVAVTLYGSTATLYVNGVAKATSNVITNDPSNLSLNFNYLGKSQFAADPLFRGMIDDFRLYNYGLSAAEVAALLDGVPAITPSGLRAVSAGGKILLAWNSSATAQTYTVKRATTTGGPYTTIASGVTAANYTDTTGLTLGNTYYYVVSATNASGESADSDEDGVVLSDVVAHYRFNETSGAVAGDSAGNALDGALANNPSWAIGLFGNALGLSGANQYATLPAGITSALTDFSISGWVKVGAFSTFSRIFDFGTGTTNYMFLTPQYTGTSPNNAKMRFAIRTPSVGEQVINSSTALTVGTWAHFAVTLSGTTGTLYLNGVQVGQNTAMTLNPASLGVTTLNYLGKSQFNDPYFNGVLDEFRLYNRALTAAEITTQASPAPTDPTNLTASGGETFAILNWSQADAATSYTVKRATVSGGPYTTVATGVTGTIYTDTGLTNGTTYYYTVSSSNWLGTSADSVEASVTPNAIAWTMQDIGAVGAAGTSSLSGATYSLSGSGTDIGGTADELYFRGVLVSGDCSITARVVSVQNTNVQAKAGVMIRNSLAAGSANAAELVFPTTANGVAWQARTTEGGATTVAKTTGVAPPYWVRLVRTGNTVQGYHSANGSVWAAGNSATLDAASSVYMGLAVTSYVDGTLCAATFENVSLLWLPSAPASLVADAGYLKATLNWNAVLGAASYILKRSTVSGGPYTTIATGLTASTYTDSNLTAGTDYYYVVSAVNSTGEGPGSNEADVMPLSGGTTVTFNSVAADDGFVRESTETSGIGGAVTSTGTFRTGDDSSDRQNKGVLSFDTAALPDNANVLAATLKIRRSGLAGTSPFTTHGAFYADIKYGGFSGNAPLETTDFEAAADVERVVSLSNATSNGAWSTGTLNAAGRGLVNKFGLTQFRAYHSLDDNDDLGNDYLTWNSGNDTTAAYRPILEVIYNTDVPNSAPRVHLPFEENSGVTASDFSGFEKNGTLVNGPLWSAGKIGNAVALDGANDHVTLPSGVVSNLHDATFCAWVKLNSLSSWSRLFDFGTGTTNYMFLTPRATGTNAVRFAIKTSPVAEQVINGTAALPTGVWTHVAVTLSGTTGTLFVNGVQVGQNTSMTLKPSSLGVTAYNYLGRSQFPNDPYLNGGIDEFKIYGKALAPAEIALLALPPAVPSGLAGTAGDAQISLGWNTVNGATHYNLKRATTSGGPYTTIATLTDTVMVDTGVANPATYYYVVSASSPVGESANSSQISAVPMTSHQAWRQAYFGTSGNSGNAADGIDFDADGRSNLLEYATGTNPTVKQQGSAITLGTAESGAKLSLKFSRIADPGLTYEVLASDNLTNWTSIWTSTGAWNVEGEIEVIDSEPKAAHSKRFLKLQVVP